VEPVAQPSEDVVGHNPTYDHYGKGASILRLLVAFLGCKHSEPGCAPI
jgi:hypothetical protein